MERSAHNQFSLQREPDAPEHHGADMPGSEKYWTSSDAHPRKEHHPPVLPKSPSGSHLTPGFVHAFSGATAGFASGVVTCPLDVIKTKLQAQGGFTPGPRSIGGRVAGMPNLHPTPGMNYKGLAGTAKIIWREDGMLGFYRGLGPIILGYLPTWAVYFTVYERAKEYFKAGERKNPWMTHIISAMIAGGCSTICTNPIWVIKTRLMSQAHQNTSTHQAPWQYKSTLDAARTMYRVEGIRAFYSGLAPALLGLSHVAVQFPLYEEFKRMFRESEVWNSSKGEFYNMTGILASSILSKICASSATYPHEVIRTRMQTQQRVNGEGSRAKKPFVPRYRGVVHAVKTVYLEEGWRAFYAGMGTNMVRAVPASAMTLLTYEFMVKEMSVFIDTSTHPIAES
ncbi:Mitoferrin [Drechslerella dactyloides]|uniref:Mitoferrin n=1 Tax=Drechslerella dactyloides TaxID=74499 RepID=A0AAD6NHV1_DREDA|nr:Mitoferrin [Drechslerella dactyloides]